MIKHLHFQDFDVDTYPFTIPSIQYTKDLDLSHKISIFVGDNGSGKSTLLKAIAYYNNSINVSKNDINSPYYLDSKELASKMRLSYSVKQRAGFFFSGEEFITYINSLKTMKAQIESDIAEIKKEFKGKNAYSLQLALGPLNSQLYELKETYQGELNQKSHGEGFLTFFKSRMHQKGIYLLDEPETPLSAINQYQLVVMITDLVRNGSQVIIATHSPIIMALKGAKIYNFTEEGIKEINYEDIESVQFTKHFLNDKDNFIERL